MVDEVIERMDEYYLSKEDWDMVVELGVDEHRDEMVMKKISAAVKSALTRKYVVPCSLLSKSCLLTEVFVFLLGTTCRSIQYHSTRR